jgi:hypothetical protein
VQSRAIRPIEKTDHMTYPSRAWIVQASDCAWNLKEISTLLTDHVRLVHVHELMWMNNLARQRLNFLGGIMAQNGHAQIRKATLCPVGLSDPIVDLPAVEDQRE